MQLTYLCSIFVAVGAKCIGDCNISSPQQEIALVQRHAGHVTAHTAGADKTSEAPGNYDFLNSQRLQSTCELGSDGCYSGTDCFNCGDGCLMGPGAGCSCPDHCKGRACELGSDGCYSGTECFDCGDGCLMAPGNGCSCPDHCKAASDAPDAATAVGDPHLVNIRGEQFSLFTSGQVEFIRVPYEAETEKADFTVHAKIQAFGASSDKCNKAQYVTGLLFDGSWFKGKPLKVNVDVIHPGATKKEMKVLLGGVPVMPSTEPLDLGDKMALEMHDNKNLVLKVDGASVAVNLQYYFLNVEAKSFAKFSQKIGGLLGEDDHEGVSSKPPGCERQLLTEPVPVYSSARMTA